MQNFLNRVTKFLKSSFSVHERSLGWINLARGFIIIMVVYRHSFEGIRNSGIDISAYKYLEVLNNMMYTFRMPLFFVISGILMSLSLRKSGLGHYVRKRAEYILYPYVIWCVIQISLKMLVPQFVNGKTSWSSFLDILYNPREIEQFWYLYALFNIMALYSLLKVKFRINPGLHILIALAFFLIAQYTFVHGIRLYFINDILGHYIFFATGDLASSFVLDPKNREKIGSYRSLLIVLPAFLALHYYYLAHPEVLTQPFILVITFSGIIFAIIVSFMLENTKGLQWLKVLGANSLYIYLMHVMIMAANRFFLLKVLKIESIPVVLFANILVGLFLPIVVYNIMMRTGFWWLFSPNKPVKMKVAYVKHSA
ncbi:MAG TPA: acyltransferase [Chitinophagaceae bacterium]|nr:acyltransferase [Chitinophagaceae bacterium]